jgi:hypothetical protein
MPDWVWAAASGNGRVRWLGLGGSLSQRRRIVVKREGAHR